MILAIDPGYAKCGWAIVAPRTARLVGLGVITTVLDPHAPKSTDRARRVARVARMLAQLARANGCRTLAAEQALAHGAAAAVAANILPWGVLIGIAVAYDLELVEVSAKAWQHAALGTDDRVDYAHLERRLAQLARSQGEAELRAIAKPLRTHALDALGVGLYAARTTGASRIVRGGEGDLATSTKGAA